MQHVGYSGSPAYSPIYITLGLRMPDTLYWPLFITFLAATIGAILKAAEATHAKKLSDDECTRLRKLIDESPRPSSDGTPKVLMGAGAIDPSDVSIAPDMLVAVLGKIAELHSQEIPATPSRLATDLSIDPEILLAHMWKFHNEQYITYRNDGKRPELDTSFILSPKAWQKIKIIPA